MTHLTNAAWLWPKELVARRWTIDGPQLTVLAVDDITWRLLTRGSGTDRGGWWGRSRATCGCGGSGWERQGKTEEGGKGGGGGGAMQKWCVV